MSTTTRVILAVLGAAVIVLFVLLSLPHLIL